MADRHGSPISNQYWLELERPLDGKTYFENLDEAVGQEVKGQRIAGMLVPSMRMKGLKFVVRQGKQDDEGNWLPLEYWFTEDYQEERTDWGSPPDWVITVIPAVIPQPVLFQPGGTVDLPDLSGEDLPASLRDDFEHKNFEVVEIEGNGINATSEENGEYENGNGNTNYEVTVKPEKMTINQYADRAPNAWTGSKSQFYAVAKKAAELNDRSLDGTYFAPVLPELFFSFVYFNLETPFKIPETEVLSILEKANHFLPKSFNEAPKW